MKTKTLLLAAFFMVVFSLAAGAQQNDRPTGHASHASGGGHPAAHPTAHPMPAMHAAAPHAAPASHPAGHAPAAGHEHPHFHHPSSGFNYHVHAPSHSSANVPNAVPAPAPAHGFHFHHPHNMAWSPAYISSNNGYQFYPYTYYNPTGDLSGQYQTYPMNDGGTYYYDQGTFYQNQGDAEGYSAVTPPLGMVIGSLPSGINAARIYGKHYYIYNGVYYVKVPGGFKVVESPILRHYYNDRRR